MPGRMSDERGQMQVFVRSPASPRIASVSIVGLAF
jgi:hypothetical protein